MKASVVCSMVCALAAMPLALQGQTVSAAAVDNRCRAADAFEAEDFIKLKRGENLGEVLGVAVNSKGQVAVLNHPGSATTGPLFGNATTEILLFDRNGTLHPRDRAQGVCAGLRPFHPLRPATTTCGSSTRARTRSSSSIRTARC